ncbi:TPM domain-containing protein [Glutamicibacter sp. NPDC127525]|uniref:TPM domain-containing protein n=1 Tax=unclassified Glutamicibacter TaxID=2627139 RepID=UPI003645AE43
MRMKARRLIAGAVLATVASFGLSAPAMAESPVTIPPGDFVVDSSGVLGSDEARLESEIKELRSNTGLNLFAIFVDEFSNPGQADQWAAEVANQKGLGSADSILVVATETRQAYFAGAEGGPIAKADTEIYSSQISPALSEKNWAGAVEGAIAGMRSVEGGDSPDGSSSGGGFLTVVLAIGAVAVVGFLFLSRRSKKKTAQLGQSQGQHPGQYGAPAPQQQLVPLDKLRLQADQLLVAADDSIRSSQQELGFAEAQYGKQAVQVYVEDIEQAKNHLTESFRLQQQLDDDIPDTEQDQRSWLNEIIDRCKKVNSSLQAHADEFKQLRQLEQNAEDRITEVSANQEPLNQRLSARVADLERLAGQYDASAVSQIKDNADQAAERLTFASSALKQASEKLATDRSNAAILIQNAEEAHDQADVLLKAINKAGEALGQAQQDLKSAIALAERDLAQANAFVGNGANPRLSSAAAGVESTLANTKQALSSGKYNPLALITQLDESVRPLSEALSSTRNQAQQEQSARAQLDSLLHTAASRISGTDDYIRARRGGVRSSARTRLAEAQRTFDEARSLSGSDPLRAVGSAQRAIQLADQAAQMAESDVSGFDGFGDSRGYGNYGRGRGGGMFDGIGGAMLGGILINTILGGGGHGGHSDGGDGGGFFGGGGFGGFGGGGGGFGGGDFGGGGGGNF